jgi:hypothetical protein
MLSYTTVMGQRVTQHNRFCMHANKTSQMSSFEEKHYHHLSRQLNGSTVSFSRLTAITKQILVFFCVKTTPQEKEKQ